MTPSESSSEKKSLIQMEALIIRNFPLSVEYLTEFSQFSGIFPSFSASVIDPALNPPDLFTSLMYVMKFLPL
jgi:hypothetical protein